MEEYNQTIAEYIKSQDDLEFELGDTLDIKTSIALVVILFLAGQSAWFLSLSMPRHWHIAQIVSVICISISGVLAVVELLPRKYTVRMSPPEFLCWVEKLRDFYREEGVQSPETSVVEFVRKKEMEKIKARFAKNSSINARKSKLVDWSFRSMLAAIAINLGNLIALSSGWRF